MNRFSANLRQLGVTLRRAPLETLQLNVGRKCNQACRHCHVDAAPWRTEMLGQKTAERIGAWILQYRPPIVDITGGAPELSEHFCYLVETSRRVGATVIDRNNLTIIEEPGYGWLPEYLASQGVEIIASLPCYQSENVTRQRGQGVFEKSIRALRKLNQAGYGTALPIHLVYNPIGASLPPPQDELERDYKEALGRDYGIVFNRLFTLTNVPIARFAESLRAEGNWDGYMELLANHFNSATLTGLMCRTTLSVGYDGELYDCDFNQMLGLRLGIGKPLFLWDITPEFLTNREVCTGSHCFACTAGAGSSCTGAVAGED